MDANKSAPHEAVSAEPDRVSSRVVVGFGIVLVILTIVAMALMAALFRGIDKSAQRKDAATVEAAGLQTREGRIRRHRACSSTSRATGRTSATPRSSGSTYGWMDRSTGAATFRPSARWT
jgi:type II secretory pathway pseudopilin PulG